MLTLPRSRVVRRIRVSIEACFHRASHPCDLQPFATSGRHRPRPLLHERDLLAGQLDQLLRRADRLHDPQVAKVVEQVRIELFHVVPAVDAVGATVRWYVDRRDTLAAKIESRLGDPFDYDAEAEGIRVLDRYTFRVTLGVANPRFIYLMADPVYFGAVARELRERNFMKIVSLASEVV